MIGGSSAPPGRQALFVVAILTGSFLLFLVQPMIARMALPRLGGAPSVWNSAMVAYQALLLGGYAYAHALGRFTPRRQVAIHIAVLLVASLWLPIGLIAWRLPPGVMPELWVPWLLAASIGPLFLAVAAQAPLLQRWFANASGDADPYRLYAASNFGSFAGLLAYPLLVEPLLPLAAQRWLWTAGYVMLVVLVALCATRVRRTATVEAVAPTEPAPSARRIGYWVLLAMVPSGLMLATSAYITTDIVAMPLLWVIPLGLYLLSFTIAFAANRDVADLLTRIAPVTILLFGGVIIGGFPQMPLFGVAITLALLFMAAVALHTALYRSRPEPARLTGFYLAMALGGALGGIFAGLIAPVVFDWTWEYPLLIVAAGMLAPQVFLTDGIRALWHGERRIVALASVVLALGILFVLRAFGPAAIFGEERHGFAFVVIAGVGLASIGARLPYVLALVSALALFGGFRSMGMSLAEGTRTRSYFGVYTIAGDARQRVLTSGTTVHGIELMGSPARERTPTTYYVAGSGVGAIMRAAPALYGAAARIGVVGLGAGTLACYARPQQHWRFYEIDPAIVRLSRDEARFHFLSRCAPTASIVLGDARLSLERTPAGALDILALDAFSSDAVPMHLLTREAFADYARVLSPRGVLAVHISNRFLDLAPVVSAAARAGGWHGLSLHYTPSPLEEGASMSVWIALSLDPSVLTALARRDPNWAPLKRYPGFVAWSDDFATILPLVKF